MAIVVALVDAFFPYIWSLYLDEAITPAVETFQKTGELQTDYSKLYSFGYTYLAFLIAQVTGVFVFIWYAGKIRHTVIYDLRRDVREAAKAIVFLLRSFGNRLADLADHLRYRSCNRSNFVGNAGFGVGRFYDPFLFRDHGVLRIGS
ncbi:MAG: hypothetical protein R3C26_03885 [Calditrichia bacterium]